MNREAMYYKVEKGILTCALCPHRCRIEENQLGRCKVRKRIGDRLYSLNDGKITSCAYDPIEKKPLSYFHRGSSIFSIGSMGCNMCCDFCQNVSLLSEQVRSITVSDDFLLEAAGEKGSIGIAYTYNEPTVSYEMTRRLAQKARQKGLLNVLVTNGFIEKEPLKELLLYVDAMNIDYKMEGENYKQICCGEEDPVLKTIQEANKSVHVEITVLLIPGLNTQEKVFEKMMENLWSIDPNMPLHLSRYFPSHKRKTPATPIQTMKDLQRVARRYMKRVELGNVW